MKGAEEKIFAVFWFVFIQTDMTGLDLNFRNRYEALLAAEEEKCSDHYDEGGRVNSVFLDGLSHFTAESQFMQEHILVSTRDEI